MLSLFGGGASSEVRRCFCTVVDESRSSLAARCVSFYQIVSIISIEIDRIYLSFIYLFVIYLHLSLFAPGCYVMFPPAFVFLG